VERKTASAESNNRTLNSPSSTLNFVPACSAAVDDLIATRRLATALDAENKSLTERLATEKQRNALLGELNETRKSENAALETAIRAKNETIAAKDAAIAAQDKLIAELRSKRSSPWRRLGDILIGAAVIAILK
jgi:septal ring factor EnvC (AmiA/AmiB activator)